MKKITLIWAALFALALTGCKESSDPEQGNSEVAGVAGRSLVSKITYKADFVDEDDDDEYGDGKSKETVKMRASIKFSYKNGLLARLAAEGSYNSLYEDWYGGEYFKEEDKVEGSADMDFTYNGAALTKVDFSVTGTADGTAATVSGSYTFKTNDAKALVMGSGKVSLISEWYAEEFQCGYDQNDYLMYIEYNESGDRTQFEWTDGNLSKIGWSGPEKKTMRDMCSFIRKRHPQGKDTRWSGYRVDYSEKENKTNIDFAYIAMVNLYEMEGMAESFGFLGFMGKESKNLPAAVYYDYSDGERDLCCKFKYSFNSEGLVKSVEVLYFYYDYDEGRDIEESLFSVKFSY